MNQSTLRTFLTGSIMLLALYSGLTQREYETRLITPQDGLPDRGVLSVEQGHDGLMWYITQAGLGNYNGYEFKHFGLPGVPPAYLFRIAFDPEGNVYVNETTGSIFKIVGEEFIELELDKELLPDGVYDFAFDALGQLWVMSADYKRVVLFDENLNPIDSKANWETSNIVFDRRYKTMLEPSLHGDMVYVHTELNEVIAFDLELRPLRTYDLNEFDCKFIYNFFPNEKNELALLCPSQQLFTFDASGRLLHKYDEVHFVAGKFPTYLTRNGKRLIFGVWSHSAGDFELATGIEEIYNLTTEGYPSVSHTYSLAESRTGNLWMGSELGIVILSPRQQLFESFDLDNNPTKSISGNGIRTILETEDGIWFSTDRYPFYKLDPGSKQITKQGDSTCVLFNYPSFYHGMAEQNGKLHTIRNTAFDPKTGITECTSAEVGDFFAEFDASGHFYTLGSPGLRVYDEVGGQLADHVKMPPTAIFNLVSDSQSSIWVCTATGVLQYQRGAGIVRAIVTDSNSMDFDTDKIPGLRSGITSDIAFTADGRLWVGTSAGLHMVDTVKEQTTFIDHLDIPNQQIYSILPEGDSALWLGTGNGLIRYDIVSGNSLRFVTEDGIPHNEFNRRAKLAASDGWYYMGGIDGICRFRPERVLSMHQQTGAQLALEDISRFDGSEITTLPEDVGGTPESVTLRPKDRIISFEVSLADYMLPELNEYRFQLEGLEPEWSEWRTLRTATYYNLDPGNYTFRAQARSGNKIPASNELAVDLIVKQAFYKSTLFWVLMVLLISVVIYSIVRYRFEQQLKLERLRTRIASDLHDEVGGVLSGIAMQMDLLKRDVPTTIQQRVRRVAGSSRDAASKMRDVIWSVDSSRDTFEDLEERMKAVVNEMLQPFDITWKFNSTGIDPDRYINSLVRQHVYLIFKEAISNIAKHSGASHVVISITPHGRKGLEIIIQDNGSGFSIESVKRGYGIDNMQGRAQKIDAELTFSNKNGTQWKLVVPRTT